MAGEVVGVRDYVSYCFEEGLFMCLSIGSVSVIEFKGRVKSDAKGKVDVFDLGCITVFDYVLVISPTSFGRAARDGVPSEL